MTLLSPLGLLWLGSIPVLLWLWRLASTQRRIEIPSLIPFEHLLRRAPKRRRRLVVNLLFWLQLAALISLALALARPVLIRDRAKTVLVVLDTSASMGSGARGGSSLDQAKQAALTTLARKRPAEQWLVMTTAPIASLTSEPTSDAVVLARAIRDARVSDLGGNLATTVRIGRALLGEDPAGTLVLTDEAPPADGAGPTVRWVSVGTPLPNVALVGLDTQGSLCNPEAARIIVTVQNFSDAKAALTVVASQDGRRFADIATTLSPRARQPVSLALPGDVTGPVELGLATARDGLAVDNRAWVDLRRAGTRPIVVRSKSDAFTATMSRWLGACPALQWSVESPSDPSAEDPPQASRLVITDEEQRAAGAAGAMVFFPPTRPTPVLSHWVSSSQHPIGSYLSSVEVVSAALNVSTVPAATGTPVIVGLVGGRQVPIVVAEERDGHRRVLVRLDPVAGDPSTPALLAFFNSLRWLMGMGGAGAAGESVTLSGFAPGTVRVSRPDGETDVVNVDRGTFRYDPTTLAGRYRFSQGRVDQVVVVNFFDPLESNLLHRVSTWQVPRNAEAGFASPRKTTQPLANLFAIAVLILLVVEWWGYSRKRA